MLVIGYTIRIPKTKIDYNQLHLILDDVTTRYMIGNYNVSQLDTSLMITAVEQSAQGASRKATKKTAKKATKKQCKSTKKVVKKAGKKSKKGKKRYD